MPDGSYRRGLRCGSVYLFHSRATCGLLTSKWPAGRPLWGKPVVSNRGLARESELARWEWQSSPRLAN